MPGLKQEFRAVFDTNVVLSALLFRQGRLAALRSIWHSGRCKPVICTQTMTELTRVIGYAKFKLDAAAIHEALGLYLPYVEIHEFKASSTDIAGVPHCRDPKDQIFLDLAHSAKVDFLVTGDDDLLVLNDPNLQRPRFRILKPQDFMEFIAYPF